MASQADLHSKILWTNNFARRRVKPIKRDRLQNLRPTPMLDLSMRIARIIVFGIALIAAAYVFREAFRTQIKVPVAEMLVPFQGHWLATNTESAAVTDITICADRRISRNQFTITQGSTVQHFNLSSLTLTRDHHLFGKGFFEDAKSAHAASSLMFDVDIRLTDTNLLFTIVLSTSDKLVAHEPSAETLVCIRK